MSDYYEQGSQSFEINEFTEELLNFKFMDKLTLNQIRILLQCSKKYNCSMHEGVNQEDVKKLKEYLLIQNGLNHFELTPQGEDVCNKIQSFVNQILP